KSGVSRLASVSRFGASPLEPCGEYKRVAGREEGKMSTEPETYLGELPERIDPQLKETLARFGRTVAERTNQEQQQLPAKVIQFPLFPEEKRPVSNDVARSALFSCVQGKDRQMMNDVTVATVDNVEIIFSGEQFNQDDHDVLMQLVYMAKHKPLGEYVTIP